MGRAQNPRLFSFSVRNRNVAPKSVLSRVFEIQPPEIRRQKNACRFWEIEAKGWANLERQMGSDPEKEMYWISLGSLSHLLRKWEGENAVEKRERVYAGFNGWPNLGEWWGWNMESLDLSWLTKTEGIREREIVTWRFINDGALYSKALFDCVGPFLV